MQLEYSWKPTQTFQAAVNYALEVLDLCEYPGVISFELVEMTELLGDAFFDGVDHFTVRLTSENLPTLFHELTHVMQYANNELEVYDEGHGYWQGSVLSGLSYAESPWEIEANRLEKILYKCFLKERNPYDIHKRNN